MVSWAPACNRSLNISCRFAIERTTTVINIWFWARNDGSVPSDIKGGASVNTNDWVNYFIDSNLQLVLLRNRENPRLRSLIHRAISLHSFKSTTSLSTWHYVSYHRHKHGFFAVFIVSQVESGPVPCIVRMDALLHVLVSLQTVHFCQGSLNISGCRICQQQPCSI